MRPGYRRCSQSNRGDGCAGVSSAQPLGADTASDGSALRHEVTGDGSNIKRPHLNHFRCGLLREQVLTVR